MNTILSPRLLSHGALLFCTLLLVIPGCSGCGGNSTTNGTNGNGTKGNGSTKQNFLSMGTAPIGGAFPVVGGAIAEVLNGNKGDNNWKVQAKGTKGSQENIRRLAKGNLQLALSNSAITYFAVRGESGWDKKYDMRAVVTIAPNVAMFIANQEKGIKSIADLIGKRVICGPAGAGFDMFIGPLIEAHGVKFADFTKLNDTQAGAVGQLADGSADAAFLGGAVPTGSVQQACVEQGVKFVPFDEETKLVLVKDYPFFQPVTITQDKYSCLTDDFAGLNVGSMHLITSAGQDDEMIYQITKTIWENRGKISHPAAKFINEKNAARYTGTDFHPGAIRFYKEIGIWPEDGGEKDSGEKDGGEKEGAGES